ncbi:MAG: DUF1570 domain-containing protein [Phycisphaerales bacterium JB037]
MSARPRSLPRIWLVMALALTTLLVQQLQLREAVRARDAALRETDPEFALRKGHDAVRAGRLREADALYRIAIGGTGTRIHATIALEQLHRFRGYELQSNEARLAELLARLGPGFARFESDHFVVLSDGKPSWAHGRLRIMEHTRREFMRQAQALGLGVVPHEEKLVGILFRDHADYREFAAEVDGVESPWVAGYYTLSGNRVVFYDDRTSPAVAQALRRIDDEVESREPSRRGVTGRTTTRGLAGTIRPSAEPDRTLLLERRASIEAQAESFAVAKIVHETVHLLSFNCGVQRGDRSYPIWVSEGLSLAFETDQPDRAFGPFHASEDRERSYLDLKHADKLIAWEDMIGLTSVPEGDHAVQSVYAQSYVLFTVLATQRREDLRRYLDDLTHGSSPPTTPSEHRRAFERHVGPVSELERLFPQP